MCQAGFENLRANGSWDLCDNFITFYDIYYEDSNTLLCINAVADPFSRNPYLMVDKTTIDVKYRAYFIHMQVQLFPEGKLP